MIDGIQIVTNHFDVDKLVNDEKLDFAPLIAPLSFGGIVEGYKAKLRGGLFVKIKLQFEHKGKYYPYPKPKLEIKGSLHKFKDGRNDTDFHFIDVCSTIDALCKLLSLEPSRCEVHTLEFGVNIPLSMHPKDVFGTYVSYNQKRTMKGFVSNDDNYHNSEFDGVKCSLSQFGIKIYDKGFQYKRSENIMRFECQVLKMQYLEKKKVFIKTLQDLKNKEVHEQLSNILIALHGDILKVNKCDTSKLSHKDKMLFDNGQNLTYWEQLKEVTTNKNSANMKRKREMKRFKFVNEECKTDNRHEQTGHLIGEKCKDLIKKTVPLFTNYEPIFKNVSVPLFTLCIKVNKGTFNPLPIYF
jgi:hypothetical protein